MCGSMVDIQSATAENRQQEKKKKNMPYDRIEGQGHDCLKAT